MGHKQEMLVHNIFVQNTHLGVTERRDDLVAQQFVQIDESFLSK
jgi:hypothetical protein